MLSLASDVGRVLPGYTQNCSGTVMSECWLECCPVHSAGTVDGCDGALHVTAR